MPSSPRNARRKGSLKMRKRKSGSNSTSSSRLLRKRTKIVLCVLCLLPFLSSCATTEPVTVTQYQKLKIPEGLLQDCQRSPLPSATWAGAAEGFKSRGKDEDCWKSRMDDIRQWNAAH